MSCRTRKAFRHLSGLRQVPRHEWRSIAAKISTGRKVLARATGENDHEAHEAAVAAVQTVLPLPWQEASIEAANAVACATRYHPEWFLRGAQHTKKWRANVRDNLNKR